MNTLFDGLISNANPAARFAFIPGAKNDRSYSYQDVLDVSARFANVLVERGVRPGDRVAVQVPKSIEAIMLYLATIRLGAIFLPLNTAYTTSEIKYFLEDATPSVFICDPVRHDGYLELTNQLEIRLDTLGVWETREKSAGTLSDDGLKASTQFKTVSRELNDLAAILYTSGTTGRSKGAMLTHQNLLSNALTLEKYWHFTRDDILLHALPIFHTHGLFVATNTILVAGASMIFLSSFSTDLVLEYLPEATSLMGVPTFYTRLLEDPQFSKGHSDHIRIFISGSAPLLAETHVEFEKRTGHRILERYGMTETSMNTSNPYEGERKAGTVGFPLPDIEIRVTDADNGKVLLDDEVGIVEVRGPNVFPGYWQMPEKTKEEFRDDGFFITGDMGLIDNDGYLQIVGRAKDLIISGGYNIYPKEIELLLDEHGGVLESAVIGVPHVDFGEAVVGIIVPRPNADLSEEDILHNLKEEIARFKQPKKIVFVDELPRNTMGKVQKNTLRNKYQDILKN